MAKGKTAHFEPFYPFVTLFSRVIWCTGIKNWLYVGHFYSHTSDLSFKNIVRNSIIAIMSNFSFSKNLFISVLKLNIQLSESFAHLHLNCGWAIVINHSQSAQAAPFSSWTNGPITKRFRRNISYPFPHTTILQQTTLNVFCQNIENLHNWMDNLWQKV